MKKTKKGFTLLELLSVIAIIGILMAVIVTAIVGGTESARSAKCLANMRSLAVSAVSIAMGSGKYPLAGSVEWYKRRYTGSDFIYKYYETLGWIRWDSQKSYKGNIGIVNDSKVSNFQRWYVSTYNQDRGVRKRIMGLSAFNAIKRGNVKANASDYSDDYEDEDSGEENAVYEDDESEEEKENRRDNDDEEIEKYVVSQVREGYVCPEHIKEVRKKRPKSLMPYLLPPMWSYVMSAKFGWQEKMDTGSYSGKPPKVSYSSIARPDKTLLFAEMCWTQVGDKKPDFSQAGGTENDCVLQYADKYGEIVGFNHKSGRDRVAHVVFTDTHVEVIRLPKHKETYDNARRLTKYLCNGDDWGIVDGKYSRIHENKDDTNDDN